jgi:hypothetical protein
VFDGNRLVKENSFPPATGGSYTQWGTVPR